MADERVTQLLEVAGAGQEGATEELLPLVYAELRRLARARLRSERVEAAQPTSLVHDAYLRLVGDREMRWTSRGHFFACAGEAMRRILIERARRRARIKHGGGQVRVTLDERSAGTEPRDEEVLALDEVLGRLEMHNKPLAAVVKLRYFAGLTIPELSHAMNVSESTVKRQWRAARAWIHAELAAPGSSDSAEEPPP